MDGDFGAVGLGSLSLIGYWQFTIYHLKIVNGEW